MSKVSQLHLHVLTLFGMGGEGGGGGGGVGCLLRGFLLNISKTVYSLFHILSTKTNYRDRATHLPAFELLLNHVEILTSLFNFWEKSQKVF